MQTIRITLNGEERSVPAGLTLDGLICALDLEPARIAVELNREIIRREIWPATPVSEGAKLEIVQFVGGG